MCSESCNAASLVLHPLKCNDLHLLHGGGMPFRLATGACLSTWPPRFCCSGVVDGLPTNGARIPPAGFRGSRGDVRDVIAWPVLRVTAASQRHRAAGLLSCSSSCKHTSHIVSACCGFHMQSCFIKQAAAKSPQRHLQQSTCRGNVVDHHVVDGQ
jgi:hypothetical protein